MERRTGMKRGLPRKENAMRETDMAYSEELVFRPLPQLVIEANVNPQEFATAAAKLPAAMSSPLGRRLAPGRRPGGSSTRPSSPRTTSSCMNTVSVPGGMGAPVKIRTAVLPTIAPGAASPAVTLALTGRTVDPLASKSAWATA